MYTSGIPAPSLTWIHYWCYLKIWNLAMQLLLRCYSLRPIHTDYDCLHALVQASDFPPSPPPSMMDEFIKLFYLKQLQKSKQVKF